MNGSAVSPGVEPVIGDISGDISAEEYFRHEMLLLLSRKMVTSNITLAEAIGQGWSDAEAAGGQNPQTPQAQSTASTPPPEPEVPALLDGTLAVQGDSKDDDKPQTSFFRRPSALDGWFAWKRKLTEKYGFTFGGSWGVLWQNYTNARNAQPNAIGSKVTLNFSQAIINRGKPNVFAFDLAVEDRRPLGTNLPPLFGSLGAGSAVPTAATFGQFDIGITQAYIRQNVARNRFQYTIGKIFAPNYVDAYPFFDDNRQFLSQAFSTSPTMASPLRGFGWVTAAFPSRSLYLKGGMFTTHSSDTGSTISDFFSKNEHFYFFEAGTSGLARTPTPIQARGPMDANNIHLTYWYRNALSDGSPRMYGLAFNANRMIGSQYMWFVRSGWSVAYLANWALSGGLGWRPAKTTSDLFGIGFGWARPVGPIRSQYNWETFYRFHITPNFALTPNFQLVIHPSLNPTVDTIWVTSLRARLSF
jgi:hypothetical protein